MKKNKILFILIILVGIFTFNYDVKADVCSKFNGEIDKTINYYIYDGETNEYKKYKGKSSYAENGVLSPFETYEFGDDSYQIISEDDTIRYKSRTVQIADEKYMALVPSSEEKYFSGWYLDENLETPFESFKLDEGKTLEDTEINLYGKWINDEPTTRIKTYELGKDLYIIRLVGNYSECQMYGTYIYAANGDYIVNTKGKLTTLPTPTKEGYKFETWESLDENTYGEKVNNILDINKYTKNRYDIIFNARYIDPNATPEPTSTPKATSTPTATPSSTSDPTEPTNPIGDETKEDITPIVPSEKKNDDNKYLYIGLASAGIGLLILLIAFAYNNKKSRSIK